MFILIFNILLAQNKVGKSIPDSTHITRDTIQNKKEKLEDILNTQGDEIRNLFSKKLTYLIHNAKVDYENMSIAADYIVIDWNSGDIFARGKTDSLGKITDNILFTQGDKKFEYKEAVFNMKTKQGTAFNIRTDEDEMVILAEKAKRVDDENYYMRRGIMTTDEYFKAKKDSLPDYHLSTNKMKMITGKNQKTLVAGPTQMYIEQFPTPFILPFLYLPSSGKKREAGVLIGTFGERQTKGFYLERWGFYVPIGEYLDLESRFGVYTKGSWMTDNKLRYVKRYKYSGNFNIIYEKNITSTKGLDDYSEIENYRVVWSHYQDSKANPTLSFNSAINFVSQNYYNNSIYNQNALNGSVNNNQASSSISLVKRFNNNPLTISLNASASQNITSGNSNSGDVTMILPNLSVTMPQVYPFSPKSGAKKGMLQNIYMDYKMNLQNTVNTTMDDIFTSKMFDNSKNGITNQTNFGTTANIFNYFQIGINGNYKEAWTTKTIKKDYNLTENKLEINNHNGFKSYRTFGGSASISTTLYGMAKFKKGGVIESIRHMISPTISYNYMPDFSSDSWGYYGTYINQSGQKIKYSYFEGGILGDPSNIENSSVSISIANNLEMKVRDKNEKSGVKKIKIFEALNISTGYNFAADSLKWSPLIATGSSSVFNSKLKINYGMKINPYKIVFDNPTNNNFGHMVDKFGYFTIASYTMGLNFSLDPSLFGIKEDNYSKKYYKQGQIRYEKYYFDDENYAHFYIPWKLNIGLNYSHTKEYNRFSTTSATVNITGEVSPSPYWKITGSTNYDMESREFGYTRLGFMRDLRSFNISFNWVPISSGYNKTWDFYIGIKANLLKDAIKYEARNFNDNTNF